MLDVLPVRRRRAHSRRGLALDLGTTSVAAVLVDHARPARSWPRPPPATARSATARTSSTASSSPAARAAASACRTRSSRSPLSPCWVADVRRSAKIPIRARSTACVLAGNTTMNHLLLGLDADPVRMEPYIPVLLPAPTTSTRRRSGAAQLHPEAQADRGAQHRQLCGRRHHRRRLGQSMIWNQPELALFIDLGTNGELVFGNNEFLMSCACSAGPAFEGGDICCGMRATDGAIDACTIDKETMEPTLTVIGDAKHPVGICGSRHHRRDRGAVPLRHHQRQGQVRPGRASRVRHDEHGMGSYVLAFKEDTGGGAATCPSTRWTSTSFIRAKGAIFSATMTMLGSMGMDPSVHQPRLRGRRHRQRHQHAQRRDHRHAARTSTSSTVLLHRQLVPERRVRHAHLRPSPGKRWTSWPGA